MKFFMAPKILKPGAGELNTTHTVQIILLVAYKCVFLRVLYIEQRHHSDCFCGQTTSKQHHGNEHKIDEWFSTNYQRSARD